jgi:hypothetical protein
LAATESVCSRISRSRTVTEYRVYFVGIDGRFVGYEPMICANDSEATAAAARLVDGHDIEVWGGPRLVAHLSRTRKSHLEDSL